jgi:alkylhydroperoxidase family enzyme
VGRAIGISTEQIANLTNYRSDFNFSELERLVLAYADSMTQTPVAVSDALFARLREKFSEAELVELTSAIAWENYRARFNHAFGAKEEGYTQGTLCLLAAHEPSRLAQATPQQS